MTSKSSHNCIICKKLMALHFIGPKIQVESCSTCQKLWFDTEEIKEFQTYTQLRNDGKIIHSEKLENHIPFTALIFHSHHPYRWLFYRRTSLSPLVKFAQAEFATNYLGNKLTDTKFFKKYPVLTFALVVAVICAIAYCHNH